MKKIRLNLGCAGRVLKDYINIDQDSVRDMKKRYPGIKITKKQKIFNYNIFKLPFKNGTVDEITVSGKEGIQIDYSAVIKYYTEQQILDVLNDGIPYDKDKDPESSSWWDDFVGVFKSEKLDYKYLYSDDGKINGRNG